MPLTDRSALPGYLFAGDRQLAVDALAMLLRRGDPPNVLCVSDGPTASHARDLASLFRESGGQHVISGSQLRDSNTLRWLSTLALDFGLSVHFPHLVRPDALAVPARGWLNLHPAYLPYNRGWHTPSWAILDGTPIGATLHQMVDEVDAGSILRRRRVQVQPSDTAHTLYKRLLEAELRLLDDAWEDLRSVDGWQLSPNPVNEGTVHRKDELLSDEVRRLEPASPTTTREVLDRLRALTTDRWSEAAYVEVDGRRYLIRVEFTEAPSDGDSDSG